ncbi:MAG: branched-chain amino acid transport system substrate-binding protein [Candidatus Eremiobacteraeota bacterium]|nr:branched-chain amino acid transport system substrate-binding protein [Candidatus Eremiobacteraeota bacterium]
MKQTLSRGRFVAGTAGAAALTFGGGPYVIAAPTKEITIGLNVPQSGDYSEQGQDQLRAYNLAIEEINAKGGIMGMKIKTSVGDDQTKAPVARDNAQRMIERDGAVMITGGSSTGTALQVSALCQQKNVIFMAALTHGDETTNQQCHKHTFRRYNDAYMSAQSLAKTLVTRYGTGKWFHITADYAWGHSVYDNITAVVEPKGAKTIKNVLTPFPGTKDFAPMLQQAQAAKPDVLVLTEFGADMVNCLNQAAQFGLTKSAKILVPLVDEYMAKGTKDNFDNVVSTAPWYWQYHASKYPGAKKFVDAFSAKYPGLKPSNGAETAYADIYIYKMAVEKAGSIDPAKVIAVLESTKFQFTKEQEWYRKEDHQGVNSCLVVEGIPESQRGPGGFGYAKVLEVHDGGAVVQPIAGLQCKMEPA